MAKALFSPGTIWIFSSRDRVASMVCTAADSEVGAAFPMTILEELRGAAVNAAKFSVHRELFHDPTPTYVAARFYAAHRRFIRSDNFLRPASVSLLADWYKR